MAKPPPECVSLSVIHHSPADFPWYPAAAISCGRYAGVEYFRQGQMPKPPPAPRPKPSASSKLGAAAKVAAGKAAAEQPGHHGAAPPASHKPPAAIGELTDAAARAAQPAGDVDADEDPDAYEPGEPPEADDDPAGVDDPADAAGDV